MRNLTLFMATARGIVASPGLHPRFQPLLRLLLPSIIGKRLLNVNSLQRRFTRRTTASGHLATRTSPPTTIAVLPHRRHTSSSTSPDPPPPPTTEEKTVPSLPDGNFGLSLDEYYALSGERKLKLELEQDLEKAYGDGKWGYVVFRTTYKPELDRHWEAFKVALDGYSRRVVAGSDAPEIAERLEWVFIEDPALEGASRDELRHRFWKWAISEDPAIDPEFPYQLREEYKTAMSRTGIIARHWPDRRHSFFVQVDEASLRSLLVGRDRTIQSIKDHYPNEDCPLLDPTDPATTLEVEFGASGWVNLVDGWWVPGRDPESEADLDEEEKKSDLWTESWFMVAPDHMATAGFFYDLPAHVSECWYNNWAPPDYIVAY